MEFDGSRHALHVQGTEERLVAFRTPRLFVLPTLFVMLIREERVVKAEVVVSVLDVDGGLLP